MGLADLAHELLGGDLLLRVRADATGIDTDLSAKLTSAERAAEVSATRISRSSTAMVASTEKVQIAQLRATAAQETYNKALLAEERNVATVARAQATLISARRRATAAQAEQTSLAERAAKTNQGRGLGIASTVGLLAATYGLAKLAQAYHEGVQSAEHLQTVQRQTDTELESTGNTAGVTADHVHSLAEQVAHYSGTSDLAVQSAANLLLTFTQINDASPAKTFDKAVKAAEDMAVAYHNAHGGSVDVAAQAKLLGLALNDPISAMSRLTRAGISFTAQQKEQIKTLAKAGELAQAQALILDLVEKKVGGSAKAFGEGTEGSAARAKVAYDELSRSLSKNLLPVVTQVENAFTGTVNFFADHKAVTETVLAVAALGTAFFVVEKAIKAYQAVEKSELVGVAARLLGYRSLERAQLQLAAAEDRHAEAASRVALAERAATRATVTSAETSTIAAAEQNTAAGGSGGGLFARLVGRGGGAEAGAATAGGLAGSLGVTLAGVAAYVATTEVLKHTAAGSALLSGERAVYNFFGGSAGKPTASLGQSTLDVQAFARGRGETLDALLNDAAGLAILRSQGQPVNRRDSRYNTALATAAVASGTADKAQTRYGNALAFQRSVAAGNQKAVQQVEGQIGASAPGLFDQIAAPTSVTSQQLSAESASVSATDSTARVQLAEERLTALRTGRHIPSALQLAAAENAIRVAQEHAALSTDRLKLARSKLADATKGTAVSVGDLLKRAAQNTTAERETASEVHSLVERGISQPVLAGLLQLDQKAPGTLASVTAHITTAGVNQLNRDQRLKDAAQRSVDVAFSSINTRKTKAAAVQSANLAAQAWQSAYLAALKSPEFWNLVNSDLGRLLIGDSGLVTTKQGFAGAPPSPGKPGSLGSTIFAGVPGVTNYNFNGPVTFTDPAATGKVRQRRRQHAMSRAQL